MKGKKATRRKLQARRKSAGAAGKSAGARKERPPAPRPPARGGDLARELAVSEALAEVSTALIASSPSIDTIANTVLKYAKELTGSEHGYVSSIDPETGDMLAHTLTSMMGKQCRVKGKNRHIVFPAGPNGRYGGLWGHSLNTLEASYTNSPQAHEASRGVPRGHIRLKRFLSVPAIVGKRLVGQVALANSRRDYTDGDLEAIRRLTELYALAVQRSRAEEALRESEERFRSVVESSPMGIFMCRLEGSGRLVVTEANSAASEILGVDAGQYVGKTIEESFPALARSELPSRFRTAVTRGIPWHTDEFEYQDDRIKGVYMLYAFRTAPGQLVMKFSDVSERKRTEEEMARLAKFPDESPNPVLRISTEGVILYANRASAPLLQVWGSQAGKRLAPRWRRLVTEALEAGESRETEIEVGKRVFSLSYAPVGEAGYVNVYALDITERKHFEDYQALAARLLERLNRPSLGSGALAEVTGMIKDFTNMHAVGIRLHEADDFPYFVTEGFPSRFVRAENHLCAQDSDGNIIRDEDGHPVLECMCGSVIYGRTDPSKPFFTRGGSFWTNGTTDLLASTTDQDRGTHTRNTCNTSGYESVALIPIRADHDIIGLLQLNDRRPNRFSPVIIRFFEQICTNIGMAIKRQRAEEALRELNETLEHRVAERTAALERRASQLRVLASELTQAEQRERRRLSWMLHDHLQQLLAAAKFKIGALKHQLRSVEMAPSFTQIDDLLQQAIDSSRSLAVELSPPILYEAGLAQAVEWLGRHMQEKHGLSVRVEADERAGPEPEDIRVLLYSALRELLFNIVKHAGTKEAVVRMRPVEQERISIVVSDSGVGFDVAQALAGDGTAGGFGLFSIRERLEVMGGRITIDSAPGKGTRVTLSAPMRAARDTEAG